MKVELLRSTPENVDSDALAVIAFESSPETDPPITAQSGWTEELRASGEFTGKLYEISILHRPESLRAKKLVLIGGGKGDKFSPATARRVAGALLRCMRGKGVRHLALLVESTEHQEVLAQAVTEGTLLGAWDPDKYKTDAAGKARQIETFSVVVPDAPEKLLAEALHKGRILGEAQNLARDLVNEPANRLFPSDLVEAAKAMSAEFGLSFEVLNREQMAVLGMGALLGVAQGSSRPPFLIVIRYQPANQAGSDHLALVGKGVTFDTGGISIKPADGMEKMKYDMAGAAAVIGAMRAIAQLKPAIPVTGYIPTVENMLNGEAQRPGDIVTTMSGKTVEVINTDAEGRLILADAITYANRHGSTHIVDAATLTGAITVALGHHNVGAFTNNQPFLDQLTEAGKSSGEKTWQLPLEEEYKEYLNSPFADLANVGGRPGGSITAAWFLKEFADPTPWVHLDIASTAWMDDNKPWASKGPTGVAVRLFTELALTWPRS